MNLMRTSRSLLLCMAVMAVSFMSCDDTTDTIGTSLIDNMDKLSVFADTFNVASRTIESGPVVARNTIGYLGKVKDPETGATVTANYMVQFHTLEGFTLPAEDNIISRKDGEIVADSCDIRLYYSSCYGDSLAQMKLNVDELDHPVEEDAANYQSDFDPEKNGYLRENGVKISRSYTLADLTEKDSIRNLSTFQPRIRIRLNKPYTDKNGVTYNNYGTYLLRKYYENPENFRNSWKLIHNVMPGFYFKITNGIGSMAYISTSQINIFFRYKNDSTTSVGTTSFTGTEEVLQTTTFSNDGGRLKQLAADNTCTYLKTPAGLFTEVTLPIDEIVNGHENDSINTAKLTLTRLNNLSASKYELPAPTTLLILPEDSLKSSFAQDKIADYQTSFLSFFSSESNHNIYLFNNISGLVNAMIKARRKGETSANWNKAVVVPVTTTYTTDAYGTSTLTTVTHDMLMTNTRLVGGSANPNQAIKLSVIYSKFNSK